MSAPAPPSVSWRVPRTDPVLAPGLGGDADARRASSPHVLRFGDDYHMYYWGTGADGFQRICLAFAPVHAPDRLPHVLHRPGRLLAQPGGSTDRPWRRHPAHRRGLRRVGRRHPLAQAAGRPDGQSRGFDTEPFEYIASKPFVLRSGGDWIMWVNTFGTAYRVRSLVSREGLNWTWTASGPDGDLGVGAAGSFDDHQRSYAAVVPHDGGLRCWYTGNGFGQTGIGYAVDAQRGGVHARG